jgi:hypothetical protein
MDTARRRLTLLAVVARHYTLGCALHASANRGAGGGAEGSLKSNYLISHPKLPVPTIVSSVKQDMRA